MQIRKSFVQKINLKNGFLYKFVGKLTSLQIVFSNFQYVTIWPSLVCMDVKIKALTQMVIFCVCPSYLRCFYHIFQILCHFSYHEVILIFPLPVVKFKIKYSFPIFSTSWHFSPFSQFSQQYSLKNKNIFGFAATQTHKTAVRPSQSCWC